MIDTLMVERARRIPPTRILPLITAQSNNHCLHGAALLNILDKNMTIRANRTHGAWIVVDPAVDDRRWQLGESFPA